MNNIGEEEYEEIKRINILWELILDQIIRILQI